MRRSLARSLLAPLVLILVAGCARAAASDGMAAAALAAPRLPAGVTAAMVTLGDSLFNTGACQRCHGQKGIGARNGPSLVDGSWLHIDGSFEAIVKTITDGVPKTAFKVPERPFGMNPRGGNMNLTDEQVRAVAGYVYTITRTRTR